MHRWTDPTHPEDPGMIEDEKDTNGSVKKKKFDNTERYEFFVKDDSYTPRNNGTQHPPLNRAQEYFEDYVKQVVTRYK
jgi:hypothetical protein